MIRRLALSLFLAAGVLAYGADSRAQQIEPDRGLPGAIEVPSGPALDTALIFTNLGNAGAAVGIKAWDARGHLLAAGTIRVPGNGLVYVFASRLAEHGGLDAFVGKVEARGLGHVVGSAVMLGGPLTDLPVINRVRRFRLRSSTNAAVSAAARARMSFPLVATY